MASSLNAQRCEDFEIRVGNLPYSEDLEYDDYHYKRGLFSKACISGTPIYSRSLERKKVQAFCLLQIFLSDIRTT